MTLTHDALYFTTKQGDAFVGCISRKTAVQPIRKEKERERDNKSALVRFLEKDDCTSVRITRIPNVHRAVAISVDSEGLNFACLQVKKLYFFYILFFEFVLIILVFKRKLMFIVFINDNRQNKIKDMFNEYCLYCHLTIH